MFERGKEFEKGAKPPLGGLLPYDYGACKRGHDPSFLFPPSFIKGRGIQRDGFYQGQKRGEVIRCQPDTSRHTPNPLTSKVVAGNIKVRGEAK
jgi:hypothetical protein